MFSQACEITEEGGVWTIKTSTTLKTMQLQFKVMIWQHSKNTNFLIEQLGEPFDETTPDGREVTAVCTLEGGKIISVQKAKKDGDKSTKVYHNFLLL